MSYGIGNEFRKTSMEAKSVQAGRFQPYSAVHSAGRADPMMHKVPSLPNRPSLSPDTPVRLEPFSQLKTLIGAEVSRLISNRKSMPKPSARAGQSSGSEGQEKADRQPAYSYSDKVLLAKLLDQYNVNGVVFSSKRDLHVRQLKDAAWSKIVTCFNAASARLVPSTRQQLAKLSFNLRSGERIKSDSSSESAGSSKYHHLPFSTTGEAPGFTTPGKLNPDEPGESYEAQPQDDQFKALHHAPLSVRFDNDVSPTSLLNTSDECSSKSSSSTASNQSLDDEDDNNQFILVDGQDWVTLKNVEIKIQNDDVNNGNKENTEQENNNVTLHQTKEADKHETSTQVFGRQAEAANEYLDERKKIEALKDELTIASLKAAIRNHESSVIANEAKAAWYRAKLLKEGLAVPDTKTLSYESQQHSAD